MDRWEAIYKLFTYYPDVDRYKCEVCGKLYKSERRCFWHIDNSHNAEVLKEREKAI